MPLAKHPKSYPHAIRNVVDILGNPKREWKQEVVSCKAPAKMRAMLYGYMKAVERQKPGKPGVGEQASPEFVAWERVQEFRDRYSLCLKEEEPLKLFFVPRSESIFNEALEELLLQEMPKGPVEVDLNLQKEVLGRMWLDKPIERMEVSGEEEAKLSPEAAKLYGVEE